MNEILVTGGAGTLGRQVVLQLAYQGIDVAILSRRQHIDVPSGAKVYAGDLTRADTIRNTIENASVIIHCASHPRDPAVDLEGTKNILQSIHRASFQHFLYVSIAGVDKSSYPYYQTKYEVEKMVQVSGVPWSVLRATQFHDLVLHRMIEPFDLRDGSIRVPQGMRFQSVDVRDVANKIQQIAMGESLRSTITFGGPQTLTIEEMVRAYLDILGRHDKVEAVDATGELYDVFRSGVNTGVEWEAGKITWREFLQNTL